MKPIKAWAVVDYGGNFYHDEFRYWIYSKRPKTYRSDETVVRVEIKIMNPRRKRK